VGFNALGVFADGTAGAEHSAGEFFVIGGVILVSCALVLGVPVPRRLGDPRAGRVALVLAVIAALTSVALGALSALGYVAIYVLDWLATNGIA